MAFDRFDQGAFLAADVSAGADKYLQIEIEVAAEDSFSKQPAAITAPNLLAEDFFLKMIFVANVEDAAFSAGDKSRDDHALDEQMGQIGHDEAVFDRAGLALISIADDVLHGIGL